MDEQNIHPTSPAPLSFAAFSLLIFSRCKSHRRILFPPLHFLVMPEFFESIPDHIIPWLLEQHVFWVASAPLSKDGHVNLSPKGLKGSFRVNNANEVWYEDLMGSGKLTSLLP